MKATCLDMEDDINADPKNPSGVRTWYVEEIDSATENAADVIKFVINKSDKFLTFPVPNGWNVVPNYLQGVITRKSLGPPKWLSPTQCVVNVNYGHDEAAVHESAGGRKAEEHGQEGEILGPEFSFDTMGGTSKLLQSFRTRWRNLANLGQDNDAPNMRGAIGYSDGKIEGCEVIAGMLKWSFTVKAIPATLNYIDKLSWMTGTVNLDGDGGLTPDFMGREPYSQLFLGASGSSKAGEGWTITFNFLSGKNRQNVYLPAEGDDRVFFRDIYAHDYVWTVYREITEDGFIFQVPKAGYVEEVYEGTYFKELFVVNP